MKTLVYRRAGSRRVASRNPQKCIRTGDIDNIGKTARTVHISKCWAIFLFGVTSRREAISWSWVVFDENSRHCTHPSSIRPSMKRTTKPLRSGIKRSAYRPSASFALEKRTTSGSMGLAHADPAVKSILTAGLKKAAANRTVRSAVTATGILKSGTMFFPNF